MAKEGLWQLREQMYTASEIQEKESSWSGTLLRLWTLEINGQIEHRDRGEGAVIE